jgi:SNF2 family DNA or RNA helicase
MIQKESSPEYFNINNNITINWGGSLEFNFNSLTFNEKTPITKLPIDSLNYFTGGCLCDDVGLGKTVQFLTLCLFA